MAAHSHWLTSLVTALLALSGVQSIAPGQTSTATDYGSVNSALTQVITHGESQSRLSAIGVANLGPGKLTSPAWYLYSGTINGQPASSIHPQQTGFALFQKKSYATYGSTGIMTYDIEGTDYKLAVYWTVPWADVIYNTYFNIKVYRKELPTNKDMYTQMAEYAGAYHADNWMEKVEHGIKLRGIMTGDSHARFYVTVEASDYSRLLPPSLHTECATNAAWFGSYCWQECSPSGFCWVNKKCSSNSDCAGPLQCYEPCKKKA